MSERSIASITDYHAHVYYEAATKPAAARLREALAERFAVALGRWHDRPIGPHPRWSYQITFAPALFGEIIPWLALNRDGLTIFIHPNAGDAAADHVEHAVWMGEMLALNLDALR
jgi:DOPA 4,5-dioxygenase